VTTVVFADLVGSTGIFERLGDETAGRFVTQLTGALSKTFEQHNGRVVKLLGDGLFVVFPAESDALTACISIQKRLQEKPVRAGGSGNPVQMQMGMEAGDVVEIDGDCYGDAVNSAARLADLAGAEQILTTQRVREALDPLQQVQLRSLGPMYLRGKSEVTEIRAWSDGGFNRSLQQELVEAFGGSIPSQGLAWPSVEAVGGGVEVGFGEAAQADAFGEVLAQQSVGVLVAAALPG